MILFAVIAVVLLCFVVVVLAVKVIIDVATVDVVVYDTAARAIGHRYVCKHVYYDYADDHDRRTTGATTASTSRAEL